MQCNFYNELCSSLVYCEQLFKHSYGFKSRRRFCDFFTTFTADFVGDSSASFAYSSVGTTFKVTGLPSGVELSSKRTPSFYGAGILQAILAAEAAITLERYD